MRRYEDARGEFTRALDLDASHTDARHGRAQVQYQLGRFQEALHDMNESLALRSNVSAYWITRARIRERLGDSAGAAADRAQEAGRARER